MNTHEEKNTAKEQEILEETQQAASEPLQKELTTCKQAIAEWQEKYTRLMADFENYKKRLVKDQALWIQSSRVNLLSHILPIIDNFDRAMSHRKTMDVPGSKEWNDGIAMIYSSLQEFLKKNGVREVPYDTFDPFYHEALMQVASDKHTAGDIVEVLEKGYMLEDNVLRPAKVSVAQ